MKVTRSFFENALTFPEYYSYIQNLYAEGKTTGPNQSEAMLDYTKMTIQRTKRGLKTVKLSDELIDSVKNTQAKNWLVISEAWCGDAGNILPVIAKLAEVNPEIDLRVILRDENPEVMDRYLTNGSRSIPIFVAFDDDFNEVEVWGPRPKPAQDMVLEHKHNPTKEYRDFSIDLQKWYIADKAQTMQEELLEVF